jgi:hypothetical protein
VPVDQVDPTDPDPAVLARAGEILRDGGLVECVRSEPVDGLGREGDETAGAEHLGRGREGVRGWPRGIDGE